MTFTDYIEQLCCEHTAVQHGEGHCHFSALTDDSDTKMAARMHYPCVVLDRGDFVISAETGNMIEYTEYAIHFLDHVSDTGDSRRIMTVMDAMSAVAHDFLKRMLRDKRTGAEAAVRRLDLNEAEGVRVSWRDAALYGWMIIVKVGSPLNDLDCNQAFQVEDEEEQS